MSTIRIIIAAHEFDRMLPATATFSDFTPLQETALVASGLAVFVDGGPVALPGSGEIPITSVQFRSPALFGFQAVNSRTFLFDGVSYRGNGTGLELTNPPSSGAVGVAQEGTQQDVRTAVQALNAKAPPLDAGAVPVRIQGAGAGADRELVVTHYRVTTAFAGASVGDTITQTQILDVSGTPTTVSVLWRNQSTGADLGSAPTLSNLERTGQSGLTDAQLRASPVGVRGIVSSTLPTVRSPINITTTTLATIIPAATGQTTRVHRMKFTVSGATTVTVRRGGTVLEALRFEGPGAVSLAFDPWPWYVTDVNEPFTLQSSAAVTITGSVESITSA